MLILSNYFFIRLDLLIKTLMRYHENMFSRFRHQIKGFLIARVGKGLLSLLTRTCQIQVEGLDTFCAFARKEKCLLMLWHNRLALAPLILSRYTPDSVYAAVVSASRDGMLLSAIIHSYKGGRTIRVGHQSRYQALREIIRHVKETREIVVITPDGPRGPLYQLKPGIAVAALETQAHVFALNWEAEDYWELKTWDRFRIPKPFTKIRVSFSSPLCFDQLSAPSLEEAKEVLKKMLG